VITTAPRLDDLYKMVAHIYGEKLSERSSTATFAHFVEVCGMLTIHDRNKKREGLDVTDGLCKALGWYFPLLAKFKIKSVEQLIFRKFPGVCPYCRTAPHDEAICKQVKGTAATVNHEELAAFYRSGWEQRPQSLDDWQAMFQKIYPRQLSDRGRSTAGLLEELGELAEAVRVAELHPKYFLGEAADTFSYVMGIANEHKIRIAQEAGGEFSFGDEFIKRYPGLCIQCGYTVCVCPSVPEATVGRMAKEIGISSDETLFIDDMHAFAKEGGEIAHEVLEFLGGYNGLTDQLPLDRGDANRSLVTLCNAIADAVEASSPEIAGSLRAEAVKIGANVRPAGTPRAPVDMQQILQSVETGWQKLSDRQKQEIKSEGRLVAEFGDILDVRRVLFVHCSPQDEEHLRVTSELRIARQSADHGTVKVLIDDLPAATIDDLRRKLLRAAQPYDVVHFAGHANADMLVFEDDKSNAEPVPLEAVAEMLARHSTRSVILNACNSAQNLERSIAPVTIGMNDGIEDSTALEFTRGFYDALAFGKSIDDAFIEGVVAVKLKGGSADSIVLLRGS
jgi:NTP pyrophosphatase (non-canonical NTP hydrolase)